MTIKICYSLLAMSFTSSLFTIALSDQISTAITVPASVETGVVHHRQRRGKVVHFPTGTKWANFAWGERKDKLDRADVVFVDAFEATEKAIKRHHKNGRDVVCYISVGTLESWRPDARKVRKHVLGKKYRGRHDETWFDVRKWKAIRGFMSRRLKMSARKGCDAVEFDNIDCFTNRCIKGYTARHKLRRSQASYARWLARKAHKIGLGAGFKNAVELIKTLAYSYDFAINESCARFKECHYYRPFTKKNKAVFGIEYWRRNAKRKCRQAAKFGISLKIANGKSWKNC